ncbi:DUF3592 domain-containing protein [Sulfuriroseicoccus oceanibius]|uniref:DUF3592 domain-containing protein n=1 Tax=Sulfuriroseicoccus oceanibius TaxID=2707525 RepID=A0A6B3LAB7_9BACT|nr:DUF3592 domain-containing protein [Sulfuriroseicoccus oceanibius]QQL43792.1 DUF3592 domain-containing protein [Sulfuriroseicoccus oceanibius]
MIDLPTPSKKITLVCRILAVVLLLPALIPLQIGVWAYSHSMDFLATGKRTEAEIVRVIERPSESGLDLTLFTPVIRFTDESGTAHEFEATLKTDNPSYEVDEKVQIIYQPDEPNRWKFDAWPIHWGLATVNLVIFAVVLVTAMGMWIAGPRLITWMQINAKR